MFFGGFVIALVIALILTLIFGVGFGGRGWGTGLLIFFIVLFLGTWAGGLWVAPHGPPLWGAAWITFLIVGVFIALLLAALMPPSRKPEPPGMRVTERETEAEGVEPAALAFGAFFWILMIGLVILIIAAYF
jgi:hypothetical protein